MELPKLLWTAYEVLGGVLGRIRVVAFLAGLVVEGPPYCLAY